MSNMTRMDIIQYLISIKPGYEETLVIFQELLKDHLKQEKSLTEEDVNKLTHTAYIVATQFKNAFCHNADYAQQCANKACNWWEVTNESQDEPDANEQQTT